MNLQTQYAMIFFFILETSFPLCYVCVRFDPKSKLETLLIEIIFYC
jgi:hypothetical protein